MSKVLSGSKAALKLNGVKVAFVGSVNITEENAVESINVLDQLEVAELAPISHVVNFTCTLFKVVTNSVSALGIRPDSISDILTQGGLTMELFNNVDGRVEYTMSGVKWTSGSGSLDARGVWSGTWGFTGIQGSGM